MCEREREGQTDRQRCITFDSVCERGGGDITFDSVCVCVCEREIGGDITFD